MNKQLSLELDAFLNPARPSTHIEILLGLTPWKKTAEEAPPFIGWWRTWDELGRVQRQWWNGYVWSIPVPQNHDISDAQCVWAMSYASRRDNRLVYWCGLCRPHIAGYLDYRLVRSPRTNFWEKLHHDAV